MVGSSVGRGSLVSSGSCVEGGAVGDVDEGGEGVLAGGVEEGRVDRAVTVGWGELSSRGWSVLMAVRKMGVGGVEVTRGLPSWISGHFCRTTGNCRQFVLSEQMFKLKEVCCAPRQMRIRWLFTTWAVKHVTGDIETTSKKAKSGKTSTACVAPSTQNWHCKETPFSPVMGMSGVVDVPVAVTTAVAVTVGTSV
jgi:hypothetical protein